MFIGGHELHRPPVNLCSGQASGASRAGAATHRLGLVVQGSHVTLQTLESPLIHIQTRSMGTELATFPWNLQW